tara:strand:- start:9364 stop:10794 length:1431 start_codon:yes stop_codon:yes gene_type:complete
MGKLGFDFSLERETGWLFGSDVIALLSGLIGQAILFWALSGEDYGMFVIAMDTCFTVLVLLDSGLSARVTRDVGALGDLGGILVKRVVGIQLFLGVIFGTITLILLMNYWTIPWQIGSILIITGVATHVISMTHRGALRSIGLAKYEAGSRIIERFGMTCGYATLAFFGVHEAEEYASVAGVFFLMGGFFSMYKWSKNKPTEIGTNELQWSIKDLIVPSLPFAAGFFLLTLNFRIPKLLLGYSTGFEEVGIFNVAMIGFSAALAVPNAIWQTAQPAFGKMNNQSDRGARSEIFSRSRRIARFGLIIGLPTALIAGKIGFPLLFVDSIPEEDFSIFGIFSILMLGWSAILLTSPDWGRVMGSEKPIGYSLSVGLFVLIQVFGFVYFGLDYGVEESSICFSIGAMSSSAVYLICTAISDGLHEFSIGILEFSIGILYAILAIWSMGGGNIVSIVSCIVIMFLWAVLSEVMSKPQVLNS